MAQSLGPITLRCVGFNHGCFEIEVTGDRPPTVDELVDAAKELHPNWRFSTWQAHIDHTFEQWHRYNRCLYRLGTTFLYVRGEEL